MNGFFVLQHGRTIISMREREAGSWFPAPPGG
jgi:hypothetical protein